MPGRFSFRSARKISSRARSTSSTRRRSFYLDDDTMGSTYEVRGHSRREQGAWSTRPTTIWSTAISDIDDEVAEAVPRREADHAADAEGRHSPPDDREQVRAGGRWFRLQEQGRAVSRRCGHRLSARARSTFRRPMGMEPDTHEKMEAPTDDNGKFCSLAFKLWSDPFVGKLVFFRVYSGTLTQGRHRLQSAHEQARAHQPLDSDSGGQARGHRHLLLRRHRGDRRHQEHHHGRHALRRRSSDPARAAVVP